MKETAPNLKQLEDDPWYAKCPIFNTVSPVQYKLRPGFKFNRDHIADLTVTRFLSNAYLKLVDIPALQSVEKKSKMIQVKVKQGQKIFIQLENIR